VECHYLDREVAAKLYREYDDVIATIVGMINHPDTWVIPRTPK